MPRNPSAINLLQCTGFVGALLPIPAHFPQLHRVRKSLINGLHFQCKSCASSTRQLLSLVWALFVSSWRPCNAAFRQNKKGQVNT